MVIKHPSDSGAPARPALRHFAATIATALAAAVTATLAPLAASGPAAASGPSVSYSAQVTIPAPPSSNFAGASGGGDGWSLAFTSTQVFNVFHHNSSALEVNCHNQADASACWSSAKTITDSSGNGYSTSGQPGMYLDSATGYLYVYATRTSDHTAGVVCIDTTKPASDADPFCGFTPLSAVGAAPLNGSGWSGVGDPMLVGTSWYAVNYVAGTPSATEDELMCFDTTTDAACAGQPYALASNGTSFENFAPSPSGAVIDSLVMQQLDSSAGYELTCFDPSTNSTCPGSWPVATAAINGAPIPLLDSSGNVTGVCLATGSDPCYSLAGAAVTTPSGMTSVISGTSNWNGPAVVIGTSVYVPNQNAAVLQCFDYASDAACTNYAGGKAFSNLGGLYTVNLDPQRPTCLWVNADNGTAQIQNFDAITGGSCAQAPIRIQASSFVAPQVQCIPSAFTSLQVLTPAPSGYTSGSLSFDDANYQPVAGTGSYTLDSTGTADLTGLDLPTTDALPQFVVSLNGVTGGLGSVTVQINWSGSYDPSCVTSVSKVPSATAPGAPSGVGTVGVSGGTSVSWTTPSSDGYSPITGYDVTASEGASTVGTCTATAPSTSCTVSLPDGGPYSFSVSALNAVGSSAAATGVGYAGIASAPGAPSALGGTAGPGSATLSWSAPSSDGGLPVSIYTVTAYDGSGNSAGSCTAAAPATSCTISGLTDGLPYTFAVTAANGAGSSPQSGRSAVVVPIGPPDAPTGVRAQAGDGGATISFVAPVGTGGSPVTSYSVTALDAAGRPAGRCSVAAPGTSCTVAGLLDGEAYSFIAIAYGPGGASGPSAASTAVTPVAALVTPSLVESHFQAGPGSTGSLQVSWTAAPGGKGAGTEHYVVTVEPGGLTCETTGTSCTVSGLRPGIAYHYSLSSSDGFGTSVSTPLQPTAAKLDPSHTALALANASAPVELQCTRAACVGVANITVARRIMRRGTQVGWSHLVLATADFQLRADQKLTLKMIETTLGKVLLPRQVKWWVAHQPQFRVTLTTEMLGETPDHRPVWLT